MSPEQIEAMVVRSFLDWVRVTDKNEPRTWTHYYISGEHEGQAILATSDGHRMNVAPAHATFPQGCVTEQGAAVPDVLAPQVADILHGIDGAAKITLNADQREVLRRACAAARGITARLRREWSHQSKKTRSTTPDVAFVHITGGEYQVRVGVGSNQRASTLFSTRLDERGSKEFAIALDADYLMDALDALSELAHPWDTATEVLLCVEPALHGNYSVCPATLRLVGATYPGTLRNETIERFTCIVMPVRA